MKLCVTSTGKSIDDAIDPRFGRCQYFIIVDPDTLEYEAIENPAMGASGGAGIQAAQLVAHRGAEVILTGNVGPNAFNVLEAAGVKIVVGLSNITVRQAIDGFKSGEYQYVSGPSVGAHYGTSGGTGSTGGAGVGPGMGRGMGGGRGGGRGMGCGMGMGRVMGSPPLTLQQPSQQLSREEEIKMLKAQSERMKRNLETLQERIDALMKKKQ